MQITKIFLDFPSKNIKERDEKLEFFVCQLIFTYFSDVFDMYEVGYLPIENRENWVTTIRSIFSSEIVRKHWKYSKLLYGRKDFHEYIYKYANLGSKPNKKLLIKIADFYNNQIKKKY